MLRSLPVEELIRYFPVAARDTKTGDVEFYETPFELWSDCEWDQSQNHRDLMFTDWEGREVEFASEKGWFIHFKHR